MARDLTRLLRPRSIAVFGGKPAAEVVRQNLGIGFTGAIWPVHPSQAEVAGLPAYRSVAELPGVPDAAFIAVNRHLSVEIAEALSARGCGGAVCYASGFSEAGEDGSDLQARLIAAAGAMPFLGPNCYGVINYLDGALLWPDQHGGKRVPRGVAIVTQSGNIAVNLTMAQRALPISYLVALGNQAQTGLSVLIEALLEDDRVTAIGLHIEAIDDAGAFARACARARAKGVPIVALKTGSSAAGARLTISHTASLAGADAVVDAYFDRVGVVRVHSVPVLLETLKLLHLGGKLGGRDIASMSCSGGEAALIADAVERHGLNFRALDPAQTSRVAATLPTLVTISNPLDYHTFTWANEPALTETFAAMMAAGFDMSLLILDFPRIDRCRDADWDAAARAMIAAATRTGARAGIVASLPESMPEARAEALAEAGIVPFLGIDEALAAIAAAAEAGRLMRRVAEDWAPFIGKPIGAVPVTLTEWAGKRLLAGHGLEVPAGALAETVDEAVEAAGMLGYPVVLKAVGSAIAHKTELGAVKLNLRDEASVHAAATALIGLGEALLVERMIPDAVAELIIGIDRDPSFGPYLMVGSGGILVELVGDSRLLLLPASRDEIRDAIASLKLATLLAGYRGKPKGDIEAAIEAVLAIQRYALASAGRLVELDVNPLMVRPEGSGAVAVDVLIRLARDG